MDSFRTQQKGEIAMSGLRWTAGVGILMVGLSWCLWAETAGAGEPPARQNPASSPTVLAQQSDPGVQVRRSPAPQGVELPPGGISIEDLLLQKGTITMDEWIQIRAEQEYRSADQSRRLDSLEDWKLKTEDRKSTRLNSSHRT